MSKKEKVKVLITFFVASLYFKAMLSLSRGKSLRKYHVNSKENVRLTPDQVTRFRSIRYAASYFEREALWNPKCYVISLASKALMLKAGIHTTLHLGFRMNQDVYQGHSWVTFKNKIVCGRIATLAFYHELAPLADPNVDTHGVSRPG